MSLLKISNDSLITNCVACGYQYDSTDSKSQSAVRGNTTRFIDQRFSIWKCPDCGTIHSLTPVKMEDIYQDYPVNIYQRLDLFARGRFRNLLKRLQKVGLEKHHSILDLGCGNGIFIQYLLSRGYKNVSGYDPYVSTFNKLPANQKFDFVIANDVIEHVEDPKQFLRYASSFLQPEGTLYIGTADSDGVDLDNLEKDLMKLHQPFHRVIFNQKTFLKLTSELQGFQTIASYRRSYMDTLVPFINYRFLDEFNLGLGHEMDLAFKPNAGKQLLSKPKLLFFAFFGYFFPVAFEPAVILRRKK